MPDRHAGPIGREYVKFHGACTSPVDQSMIGFFCRAPFSGSDRATSVGVAPSRQIVTSYVADVVLTARRSVSPGRYDGRLVKTSVRYDHDARFAICQGAVPRQVIAGSGRLSESPSGTSPSGSDWTADVA